MKFKNKKNNIFQCSTTFRQALEQSYNELLNTSQELEKRMNLIDEESIFNSF